MWDRVAGKRGAHVWAGVGDRCEGRSACEGCDHAAMRETTLVGDWVEPGRSGTGFRSPTRWRCWTTFVERGHWVLHRLTSIACYACYAATHAA